MRLAVPNGGFGSHLSYQPPWQRPGQSEFRHAQDARRTSPKFCLRKLAGRSTFTSTPAPVRSAPCQSSWASLSGSNHLQRG